MIENFEEVMKNADITGIQLKRAVQIVSDLKSYSKEKISFEFDPAGTDLFSIMELRLSYSRRCLALIESITFLLHKNQIVPAAILSRAMIETVAMGCYYLHEINRLIDSGSSEQLKKKFERFFAGMTNGKIKPIHVNDALRHLEEVEGKYVTYLDNKFKIFSSLIKSGVAKSENKAEETVSSLTSLLKTYDTLSEITHPNGLGVQLLFPDHSNENEMVDKIRKVYHFKTLASIWQCHHLLTALHASKDLANKFNAKF